tara:strand:- start:1638 stop:2654 length:1017 start_codon:yes stop_codon:yes gene_type:complete
MTYDKFGILIGFANESGEFVNIGNDQPTYYNEIALRGQGKNRFFKGVGGRMLHATNFSADFSMQGEMNKKAGGVDRDKQYKKKEALSCSLNIEYLLTDNDVSGLFGLSGMGDPYLFMSDDIISGNGSGKNFFPIYAGEQVFNKCFLQNFTVDIKPFEPVTCKASFKSYDPPTSGKNSELKGLPIFQGSSGINDLMSHDSFVYGHTCELSGEWGNITDIDAVSQISFGRTYGRKEVYCLGSPTPKESLVTNIENQLLIKGTGLKNMLPDDGLKLEEGLRVVLINGAGRRLQTDPLANNVKYNLDDGITIHSGAYIVGQTFNNKAGGTMESSIVIKEAII